MTNWLKDSRAQAAERYRAAPIPDRVHHDWRYTDPGLFLPPEAGAASDASFSLPAAPVPPGITLMNLEEAAGAKPDLVQSRLASAEDDGKFEALNRAAWQSGLLVHAAGRSDFREPVMIGLSPGKSEFGALRILVVAEAQSRLSLAVDLGNAPPAATKLINLAVEFCAGPAAQLRFFLFQELPGDCRLYMSQRASLERDARFESVTVSLGGDAIKADSRARLNGPGSHSDFSAVIFADGTRHLDHRTVHEHRARSTSGTFDYRAILKDRARSVYTGLIRIEPGAAGCRAYQENRNLMLSPDARADSIPELEILDNDVDCAHGSATGPAERDHLFYLMSRGLPESEAVRAVAEGFMEKVAAKLPSPLYARLRAGMARRLEGTGAAA